MKTLWLSLLVITTSLCIFTCIGWYKASAIAQSTSYRLDEINSEYAVEIREELYDVIFDIETSRIRKDSLCDELKKAGVYLNEKDIAYCGEPLSITE